MHIEVKLTTAAFEPRSSAFQAFAMTTAPRLQGKIKKTKTFSPRI
jgi:hypothetical protein